MATVSIPKPSKWFSNKSFKLSINPRRRPPSPNNPPDADDNSHSDSRRSPEPDNHHPVSSSSSIKDNTRARENELQEVFRYFDCDGDGKISSYELIAYFGSIGEEMSQEEAQGVITDLDSDGDNLLDFGDFVRLMEREGGGGEDEDDLKQAFQMFEVEKGAGCITPKGLQQMFTRLGDSKSFEECVAMIQIFDLDGNGVINFHEFHIMMTT
ncbi:PREDICTED: probable calcium-binding protein CML41 [Nelumbo nucifera]|uniref:EF-hand domain-containing protein n=2 Tax=Nelumbo nucifera TaxID=4432 RepID=A0A822ZC83_NELNU|nr:PREDICTED: probable calcium-binding protein CML41 [Nelumbo nucifera]DAD40626.1 TPA_asm: hypothetical protein HUJ06_014949 [Nelumbo nucifera]